MNVSATITVVQIPHNGSRMGVVKLPLMPTTGFGNTINTSEHRLTTVPDVRDTRYAVSGEFARKYRELVDLGEMDPQQNPRDRYQRCGPYYMYKLSDGVRRHLPHVLNETFSRAGADEVYGTAFIFKVKQSASQSQSGEVEYENLDLSFINSAFKGRGLSASESLRWLSRQ